MQRKGKSIKDTRTNTGKVLRIGVNTINGMAICAGIGGFELGLNLALTEYRCICYIEREAYPASILVSRMAEELLDEAPIWDDIETFDGLPWRGKVDIISAGFPCQPFSQAGNQKRTSDERWIWPNIARVIDEVGPGFIFLENVPGILDGGIDRVLRSLAEMGYDAEWGRFSAAGIGAPHIRQRIFILAKRWESRGPGPYTYTNGIRQPKHQITKDLHNRIGGDERSFPNDLCDDVANPHSSRQFPAQPELSSRKQNPDRGSEGISPNPNRKQYNGTRKTRGGRPESSNGCWWEVEPRMGRVVDGTPNWVDRIRACGNGVVPAVAGRAFTELLERFR